MAVVLAPRHFPRSQIPAAFAPRSDGVQNDARARHLGAAWSVPSGMKSRSKTRTVRHRELQRSAPITRARRRAIPVVVSVEPLRGTSCGWASTTDAREYQCGRGD